MWGKNEKNQNDNRNNDNRNNDNGNNNGNNNDNKNNDNRNNDNRNNNNRNHNGCLGHFNASTLQCPNGCDGYSTATDKYLCYLCWRSSGIRAEEWKSLGYRGFRVILLKSSL